MLNETNGNLSTYESEIRLKICSLLSEIDICLIWSWGLAANLHRRPMTYNALNIEGGLWFFIPANSHLIEFYRDSQALTVALSNPKTQKCAALAGRATICTDNQTLTHFLADKNSAILPACTQPADLVLLKIDLDHMDFWEWPGGILKHSTFNMENLRTATDQKWTRDVMWSSYCQ